ncbi:MAG: hypothetical protein ACYTG0_44710 [Planctomycetota bacterium]|jgi:hypothetical protein
MTGTYKVRVKKGEYEVEVESSDKAYVDSKLAELLESAESPAGRHSAPKKVTRKKPSKSSKTTPDSNEAPSSSDEIDVAGLVAHIKDADIHPDVEKNIIDKRNVLAKIVMVFYYAAECFDDPHLTTGQIESITDQLGIKVGMANASNKIRENQRYFTGRVVRKKGQAVPYKLNRQGEKAFEAFVKGEKP